MAQAIQLYQISNANFRRYLFLARSRDHAIEMALLEGKLRNKRNARVTEGTDQIVRDDPKFASAVRRAIQSGATGPVTNSNGIALVYTQAFLPLSVVQK